MICKFCQTVIEKPTATSSGGIDVFLCPTCPHQTAHLYKGQICWGYSVHVKDGMDAYDINVYQMINQTCIRKLNDNQELLDIFRTNSVLDVTPNDAISWLNRLLNLRAFS